MSTDAGATWMQNIGTPNKMSCVNIQIADSIG